MRASRLAVVAILAAAGLAPLSAHAATPSTTRITKTVLEGTAPFGFFTTSCDSIEGDDPGGQAVHIHGPSKPPLGSGSVAISGADQRYLDYAHNEPGSDLTALSFAALGTARTPGAALDAELVMNSTGSTADNLDLSGPVNGRWHSYNLLSSPMVVTHYDYSTDPATTTELGTMTYGAYLTANPGATFNNLFVISSACQADVVPVLNVDDVSIGHLGSTTTYNYEADRLLRLSITAPKTVKKAAQFTVSGFFTRENHSVAGESVELQAKPAGAKQWIDADSLVSKWNGAIFDTEFLTRTTSFRLFCAGDSGIGQITSKTVTVHIAKPKKKKH